MVSKKDSRVIKGVSVCTMLSTSCGDLYELEGSMCMDIDEFGLARDEDGEDLPFVIDVYLSGGEVKDFFKVRKRSVYTGNLIVFASECDSVRYEVMKGAGIRISMEDVRIAFGGSVVGMN